MKRYTLLIQTFGIIVGIGSICFTTSCNSQPKIYSASDRIPIEVQAGSIAAFDLNKNGHKDLIITDEEKGTVIILLGNSKGEFYQAEGSPFPAGKEPNDIAIGDFNSDQKTDLAIANHETDYITILLGNGNGQFLNAPTSPVHLISNPHPHGIAAGDFNGDKQLDLTVESWHDAEVIVLLGDGKGTFQPPYDRYEVGRTPYYKLRVANLNNDPYSDIVTSNWGGSSISILLANGTGGFSQSVEIPTSSSPFSIAVGDMNKDGNSDIAIAHRLGNANENEADRISILLGDGQGSFKEAPGDPFPTGKAPTSVAIGDFNGDSVEDLAVANYSSGDVTIILGSKTEFNLVIGSPFKVGEGPIAIALADLNGDGKADIITANSISKDISVVFAERKH